MFRWNLLHETFRHSLWAVLRCFYRIRRFGLEYIPPEGGAVIVPNHISWLDGFLVMTLCPRPTRPMVWAGNFQSRFMKWWAARWGTILVGSGPKSIRKALEEAKQAIANGDAVLIFPEGGISRSGNLQAFRPGLMKIIDGIDCAVVPVYLDELWGSVFSFEKGKFFFKWPKKWRYPVSIHFGQPLTNPKSAFAVRQAVEELGVTALSKRNTMFRHLPKSMIRSCKRRKFKQKLADSLSGPSTGGNALLRLIILRRLLRKFALGADEKNVGVLLPPSVGGVLCNMALAIDHRVAVNLNYTVDEQTMNTCIEQAGIQHVLTTRQVMSKLELKNLAAEVVYLDDFKEQVTLADKIAGALAAFVLPAPVVSAMLGLGKIRGDDLATIIFTSGSTGTPKGVMLTYDNIASNVDAIDQVIQLNAQDTVVGILPFFHSFGYTVTLWTPMTLDIGCVYHFTPLDGKRVGMLVKKHGATVLLSTPTFLRSYLKRCTPAQFKTLDVVVAGAEKLPTALCDSFEEKFGVRPVEGYGCTELSPLVSVNVPASRMMSKDQVEAREGSVGKAIPNVTAKAVDLETGADLAAGEGGMLLIKGPNVMKGYLNAPEKTAEVINDGWYRTGDVAFVDNEGFIHITGRQSRFSKIGGEMVPHLKIEEALAEIIGGEEDEGLKAAVTAVPDERKGERLIVLHTKLDKSADELQAGLKAAGLPNLFIPSADSFLEIGEMPVLGTGKLDLKGLKQTALEHFG